MGRGVTKFLNNKYREARIAAAKYNDALSSMESAARQLNVSVDSLGNYERGVGKIVPNDVVVAMADLYNAPELLNGYCMECPIGKITQHQLELKSGVDLAVRISNRVEVLPEVKSSLMKIMDDGQITSDEVPLVMNIFQKLDDFQKVIEEFKLWCKKEKIVQ